MPLRNVLNRVDWSQLTRFGVPKLVIKNRPLQWNGEVFEVGSMFPGANHARTRQLYEQNRIGVGVAEPKEAKKKTNGRTKIQ